MIKENATMIVSQYELDRLQKALDNELKKRAELSGELIETVIVEQGRSATICVPMHVCKESEDSKLMVASDLCADIFRAYS